MSLPRVRLDDSSRESASIWLLDRTESRHLVSVRRCRNGDLFEGLLPGKKLTMRLEISGREARGIVISEEVEPVRGSIWLMAAILKSDPFDRLLSQSVEAGASVIVPLVCVRSVVAMEPEGTVRKMKRWQKILHEATKQCGAATPPELHEPVTPGSIDPARLPAMRFVAATGSRDSIRQFRAAKEAAIAVGPEGDWTDEELDILCTKGFIPVSLGPRIMRSQTAAVAAVSALAMAMEGNGNE